jgi:two-component system chemotaxis response regulator CheB
MIKVLIVEDSPVIAEFLTHILNSDPDIRVIGVVSNGEEVLEVVRDQKPDLITMDIHLPKMDGFEITRRVMEMVPTPIVIVSGSMEIQEVTTAFRAMEAGALAVVQKPSAIGHPTHEAMAKELVQTVKLMSEVRVVKRWAKYPPKEVPTSIPSKVEIRQMPAEIKLVAIGASTGGPLALQTILSRLPKDFSVPILVVQHMTAGFIQGFIEWLNQQSDLLIHAAVNGEPILPGHVYVAPDGFQMKLDGNRRIALTQDEPENGLRPSISYLFRSIANIYGENAVGVLLTGMGKDGAEELKLMKEKGAMTIAQDKESSVIHGMPGEAIKLGAATYILSPDKIAAMLVGLANKK